MSDELTPKESLCDIFVEFAGMEAHSNSPHGDFTFRFVQKRDGQPDRVVATLTFPVRDSHDGFPGMMGRAYDQLIQVMRQGLFHAGRMRTFYRSEASQRYPKYPHQR